MIVRDIPWWTPEAVVFVDKLLNKKMRILEFGSGASTAWLCARAGHVVSVEHSRRWYDFIDKSKYKNLDLRLMDRPYDRICDEFEIDYFDFVMVDGRDRVKCFIRAKRVLKPGGWIGLDDSTRGRYEEAVQSVSDWFSYKTNNPNPKEMQTGSCHTQFWRKPSQ